jgi:predicted glycoside hydrolase/deacetylase ChbG (UPF0249 family)
MCHPGRNDPALEAISTYAAWRPRELEALTAPAVRERAAAEGIRLAHFGTLARW